MLLVLKPTSPENNSKYLVYHKQRKLIKTKLVAKLKASNNTEKINISHLFTVSNGHPFFANIKLLYLKIVTR